MKNEQKINKLSSGQYFTIVRVWELSVAIEATVLIQSTQIHFAVIPQPSPVSTMLHMKFDQDWPTGLRDSQLLKVWTMYDVPSLYYKPT